MKIYIIIFILLLLIVFNTNENFINIAPYNKVNIIYEDKTIDPYEKIDIIYYINLDHRTDRNDAFINEMKKMKLPNNKIKRISGIKNKNGALGCTSSHIKILKDFIMSSHNTCIIFEDDFEFTISEKEFKNHLSNLFKNNIIFDVVCLSGNIQKYENTTYDFLKKVFDTQTTSGYMITKQFAINYLLDNFIIGKYLLENNPELEYKYAVDQYWKLLQPSSNWYSFYPKCGKQRQSYSDIEKVMVNYEVFSNCN